MTEESVNANSRKCVTLQLDPCPLELSRKPNTSLLVRVLKFQQDTEKSEFNKINFFSLNNCIYEDISTRLIKKFGVVGAL